MQHYLNCPYKFLRHFLYILGHFEVPQIINSAVVSWAWIESSRVLLIGFLAYMGEWYGYPLLNLLPWKLGACQWNFSLDLDINISTMRADQYIKFEWKKTDRWRTTSNWNEGHANSKRKIFVVFTCQWSCLVRNIVKVTTNISPCFDCSWCSCSCG